MMKINTLRLNNIREREEEREGTSHREREKRENDRREGRRSNSTYQFLYSR